MPIASEKKPYVTPKLTIHGSVENITQQGGGDRTDVPIGTPAPTLDAITS